MVTKYNQKVLLVTDYVVEITQKTVCEESSAPDFSTGVSFVFTEPTLKANEHAQVETPPTDRKKYCRCSESTVFHSFSSSWPAHKVEIYRFR